MDQSLTTCHVPETVQCYRQEIKHVSLSPLSASHLSNPGFTLTFQSWKTERSIIQEGSCHASSDQRAKGKGELYHPSSTLGPSSPFLPRKSCKRGATELILLTLKPTFSQGRVAEGVFPKQVSHDSPKQWVMTPSSWLGTSGNIWDILGYLHGG